MRTIFSTKQVAKILLGLAILGQGLNVSAQYVKPGDEPPRGERGGGRGEGRGGGNGEGRGGGDERPPRYEEPPRRTEPQPPPRREEPPSRVEPPRREEPTRPPRYEEPPRRTEPPRVEPPRREEPPRYEPPRREEPPRYQPPQPPPRRDERPPRYDDERPPRYDDERPPRYDEPPRYGNEQPPRYDEDRDAIRRRIIDHRRREIDDRDYWRDRHDRWYNHCERPRYPHYEQPIDWHRPMPDPGYWDYSEILIVADNIQNLSQRIYNIMEPVAPTTRNQEYSARLMRVLFQLVDAAESFNDSVKMNASWSSTLNNLFYLEETVRLTETTLDGYSQEYRVSNEMRALRYYVDEMLWTYRQRYQ